MRKRVTLDLRLAEPKIIPVPDCNLVESVIWLHPIKTFQHIYMSLCSFLILFFMGKQCQIADNCYSGRDNSLLKDNLMLRIVQLILHEIICMLSKIS